MTEENNLWAAITALPRPNRLVPFPRNNPQTDKPYCDVRMVVLTATETALVTAEAEKKTRQALKDHMPGKDEASRGYEELYRDFTIEGVLFRSCRHPEDVVKHFFPNQESIFKVLTTDEAGILFNHYATVATELGPIVGEMTEDEYQAWVERLQESGTQARFFLNSFTPDALRGLAMYLVNQSKNLQMGSSSPGTPAKSGSKKTSSKRKSTRSKKQINK